MKSIFFLSKFRALFMTFDLHANMAPKRTKSLAEQLADLEDPAPKGMSIARLCRSHTDFAQTLIRKKSQYRTPRARTDLPREKITRKQREGTMRMSARVN